LRFGVRPSLVTSRHAAVVDGITAVGVLDLPMDRLGIDISSPAAKALIARRA
jgi:aspartate aminotransferase-like enzyme